MTGSERILVTGSTGTVGGPLLGLLVDGGAAVVAGARDPGRYAGPSGVRLLDFRRPETFAGAVAGVGRVFLMRPPAITDTKRVLRPFIAAADAAGVSQVVFLSVMGVNRALPHWQVEQDLRRSSMAWTMLRPSFFAQNLETAYADDILDHDRIRLPAGRGRTSFIDTRDVAAVAAAVLTGTVPAHAGRAYTLTGPAAPTWEQVAALLSVELGRPISYQPVGLLTYRGELRHHDLPADFVRVQLLIHLIARVGLARRVTTTLPALLDRPATPLGTYIHDSRDHWTSARPGGSRPGPDRPESTPRGSRPTRQSPHPHRQDGRRQG